MYENSDFFAVDDDDTRSYCFNLADAVPEVDGGGGIAGECINHFPQSLCDVCVSFLLGDGRQLGAAFERRDLLGEQAYLHFDSWGIHSSGTRDEARRKDGDGGYEWCSHFDSPSRMMRYTPCRVGAQG